MHSYRRIAVVSALVLALPILLFAQMPDAKQGTVLETLSPSEVLVQATGIGVWNKGDSKWKDHNRYMLQKAELDAKRSAIYIVALGGSEPMLTTAEEELALRKVADELFAEETLSNFINWEQDGLSGRRVQELERKKKIEMTIEKQFRVNKGALQDFLVDKGVMQSQRDLMDEMGMPMIMVIPKVEKGKNPVDVMAKDKLVNHGAMAIQSMLTGRRYDVVLPEASQQIDEMVGAQLSLDGVEEDYAYQIALSVGSDLYITYTVDIEAQKFGTKKASVSVSAYETTTGRLLGSDTGYSPSAQSSDEALVDNAVTDAIDRVLQRVNAYWKEDLERGIQYKLVIAFTSDWDRSGVQDAQDVMFMILEDIGRVKENAVTDGRMDVLVWADPAEYSSIRNVDRAIRNGYEDEGDGVLERVNRNRKLLIYKVMP